MNDLADLFSLLRTKSSVKRMNLRLHTWTYNDIDRFKETASAVFASSPFCSIELSSSISESVDSMIATVCPYPTDRLEININEDTRIEDLPFSLFLTYGDAIKTLNVNVRDVNSTARLISYLDLCTNLNTLHVAMDNFMIGRALPEGTEVQLPDSVKDFTLVPSTYMPALTIIGSSVQSFAIDLGQLPSTVQLKFASLQVLDLTGCANATNEHLFMLTQMKSWRILRLDTMELDHLVRFKPVIKKTSTGLDMHGATSGSFDFGFDYLDN
ncbi:hypothetical protein TRVA0_079S00166 [Trichomonascus vanleenenianus]|uniref:uncharacterized protein n=1 Tax=Trichomonascus vanleenenianus TaxID=2268995 RepID=UPI003EC97599